MIFVGIDVAKDKHDCFITNSDDEVLFKAFTISSNREGFNSLYQKIESVTEDLNKVKVGLEATIQENMLYEQYNQLDLSDEQRKNIMQWTDVI